MRLWLQPSSPAVGTGGQPLTAEVIMSRAFSNLLADRVFCEIIPQWQSRFSTVLRGIPAKRGKI